MPLLFIAAALVLLLYSYAANLRNSLLGTAIILLGIPLYRALRSRYGQPRQAGL